MAQFLHSLKQFYRRQGGGVAVMAGMALPILLLLFAFCVDAGRLYSVKSKAQNAADAALLASAASASTIDPTVEFQKMMLMNYNDGYMGSRITSTQVNSVGNSRVATVNIEVPTVLIGHISNAINLNASANEIITISTHSLGGYSGKEVPPLEIALVLDNSDSMKQNFVGGNKMDALKQASKSLVNILYGKNVENAPKVNVSIVPYDNAVGIGSTEDECRRRDGWIQTTSQSPPYSWLTLWNATTTGYAPGRLTPIDKHKESGSKCFVGARVPMLCGPWVYVATSQSCSQTYVCDKRGDYTSTDPETGIVTLYKNYCLAGHYEGPVVCKPGSGNATYRLATTGCKSTTANFSNVTDDAPTTEALRFHVPFETTNKDMKGKAWEDYKTADAKDFPGKLDKSYNANSLRTGAYAKKLAPILFASTNKPEIFKTIDSMQPSGETRIELGLMWGWFTVSGKWQGMWDPGKPNLPRTIGGDKTIVLMTDGKNSISKATQDSELDKMCTAIKKQGITIYTVGIGNKEDVDHDILTKCATKPAYYFFAPSEEDLQKSFKQIADSVQFNTLRISQ